jgi:hypothetical protein
MRKVSTVLLSLLSLGVLGCGDSPQAVLRDAISLRNELADEALRVTDDASAKATREGRMKKMKDRQEWIKNRIDKIKDDRKKLQQFFEAMKENNAEWDASDAYLKRAESWLQSVGGDASTLTAELGSLSNLTLPQPPPPSSQGSPGG